MADQPTRDEIEAAKALLREAPPPAKTAAEIAAEELAAEKAENDRVAAEGARLIAVEVAVPAAVLDIEARGYRMATHIALEACGALRDPRVLAARLAHRLDECERLGRYTAADRAEIAALGGQGNARAQKLRETVKQPDGSTRAEKEAENEAKAAAKREARAARVR